MSNLVYVNGALYHSEELSDDFLAHYGVKGMKWGRRGLKAKNKEAWGRYANESNRAAASYAGQVRKAKQMKKYGLIDRSTYKQKRNEAYDTFSKRQADAASRYVSDVKQNKADRKAAIKNNKRAFNNTVSEYKNESGKVYRHLLNKNYLGARAAGKTRGQAYREAYTGRTRKEMIYDR